MMLKIVTSVIDSEIYDKDCLMSNIQVRYSKYVKASSHTAQKFGHLINRRKIHMLLFSLTNITKSKNN